MTTQRKKDHIEICLREEVEFKTKTTLLEDVELIHNCLPELWLDEIDTSVTILGKRLKAPLIIASMTGGIEEAYKINRDLAELAEEKGIGFALGSQRPMLLDKTVDYTFMVRDVAPSTLLLGNIGVVQVSKVSLTELKDIIKRTEIDALCVHLNPAMELVQPEGDKDFRGGYIAIKRLLEELNVEIVVKETGCGISRFVGEKLKEIGVKHVDVSGAGGTSWVKVESFRQRDKRNHEAIYLEEWGIPTAVSILWLKDLGFETIIATGGITNGVEVAKAIAIGSNACGIARHILKIYYEKGKEGVSEFIDSTVSLLKKVMLLVGARNIEELRKVAYIIKGELKDYLL